MPPNLSATPGESQIKCYSLVFYLYAPIQSAPAGVTSPSYAHSYGQHMQYQCRVSVFSTLLVYFSARCIQHTGCKQGTVQSTETIIITMSILPLSNGEVMHCKGILSRDCTVLGLLLEAPPPTTMPDERDCIEHVNTVHR